MWIVVCYWSAYEVNVDKFDTKEEAEEFYNTWSPYGAEEMYLAKVEKCL